jgi:Skp family chaperone for outer membrane proteins
MKIKAALIGFLTLAVLFAAYQGRPAATAAPLPGSGGASGPGLKIGIVSIRGVFETSKRIKVYRDQVAAEQVRLENELEKLNKEIEFCRAGLRTLVRGSADYMTQLEDLKHKEGQLTSKKEFYGQSMALQQQRITEELYLDIIEQTAAVAKEKGLDLVMEKSDPEIPAPNGTQLELAMGTHKVLYAVGCLDITAEVTAGVDAKGTNK